jgi:hypothetical protein
MSTMIERVIFSTTKHMPKRGGKKLKNYTQISRHGRYGYK